MKHAVVPIIFAVALLQAIAASAGGARNSSAIVAVSSNFIHCFQLLKEDFESNSKNNLKRVSAASGVLYAQIRHGAPYHLFLSADQHKPAQLVRDELATQQQLFSYALGQLSLWSNQPALQTLAGKSVAAVLASTHWQSLALANPAHAPYGKAAVEMLEALGYDTLVANQAPAHKLTYGENVAQAFQFARSGNAQLGLVASAQLQIQADGSAAGVAWPVPVALHNPIQQDAVLLKRGEHNAAAVAFAHYLRSPAARQIIAANGYLLPQAAVRAPSQR